MEANSLPSIFFVVAVEGCAQMLPVAHTGNFLHKALRHPAMHVFPNFGISPRVSFGTQIQVVEQNKTETKHNITKQKRNKTKQHKTEQHANNNVVNILL